MGRTIYTEDIARRVCEALAEKGSLRRVCAEDKTLPGEKVIRQWVAVGNYTLDGEPFSAAYARAKEAGIDALVDETLDIADDGSNDFTTDKDGNERLDSEHVQRSKIRIETRRWLAERMLPKKYGVLQKQEISGPDGGPVKTRVVIATGVPAEDDEIA